MGGAMQLVVALFAQSLRKMSMDTMQVRGGWGGAVQQMTAALFALSGLKQSIHGNTAYTPPSYYAPGLHALPCCSYPPSPSAGTPCLTWR